MPNPTRREREERLVSDTRARLTREDAIAEAMSFDDAFDLLKIIEAAHRREDKIRKVPRYGLDFCDDRMEPDKDGAWIHEDDILRILDAHDVPQGGST